ncbi:MAG: NHL repeat-containing protein [Oscillospiraceae bacterium]
MRRRSRSGSKFRFGTPPKDDNKITKRRSRSPKDDNKTRRSRSRLPSSFVSSLLMPIPISIYNTLSQEQKERLKKTEDELIPIIERAKLEDDQIRSLSSTQRAGSHRLFHPMILLEIGEYYSSFPFTSGDVKVEYSIFINKINPVGITMIDNDIAISDKTVQVFSTDGKFKYTIGSEIIKNPSSLCFDSKRNLLFVGDKYQVHVFSRSNTDKDWSLVYSITGEFKYPHIAVTKNEFVVCDSANSRFHFFDIKSGILMRSVGTHGNGPNQYSIPCGICFNSSTDLLYVVDSINHRVCVLSSDGSFKRSFGSKGNGNGQFNFPDDLCVSEDGQFIVVAERTNYRVQVLRTDGSFVASYNPYKSRKKFYPCHLCLTNEGDLLVCDNFNRIVRIHAIN